MPKMQTAVVYEPGGPDVLRVEERPLPTVKPGWVLVRVRAFGLNRSELITRAGGSGDAVKFPRVLGIECVGEVADGSDTGVAPGTTIVAAMGGMGRDFDGGYEDYALLPAPQVIPVRTTLPWPELGALPETFGTAWGSLELLELRAGQTLLVRGGTSSVGMAAITLAKDRGVTIVTTTRQAAKVAALRANGADHVILDDGTIAARVREILPVGADALLELVGVASVRQQRHHRQELRQHLPIDHRRDRKSSLQPQPRSNVSPRRHRRRAPLHGSKSRHREGRRPDESVLMTSPATFASRIPALLTPLASDSPARGR
jgi:NADPH2:quinone reductase